MNPQNPFFLYSKRSSDVSAFTEEEKQLAPTEKQRSIFAKSKELQEETPWRHTHETAP
jgi:hypothetical protein